MNKSVTNLCIKMQNDIFFSTAEKRKTAVQHKNEALQMKLPSI